MEGGNRDEEDRPGSGPAATLSFSSQNHSQPHHSSRHHHHYQHYPPPPPPPQPQLQPQPPHYYHEQLQHQQYFDDHRQIEPDGSRLPPAVFDSSCRASQQPSAVASYPASNLGAVTANAALPAEAFAHSLDPDDFYRDYRGLQTTRAAVPVPPSNDPMASGSPLNRQTASVRVSRNGTPRPPAASADRNGARSVHRSVSNPLGDRSAASGATKAGSASGSNGYSGVAQTSVKDLKKRFDTSTSSPSSTATRKASTRNTPRESAASIGSNRSAEAVGSSQSSRQALRTGAVADGEKGTPNRGTQRAKLVDEDHPPSDPQSFASRINKPRTSVSPNDQASKSMTHLPPQTSPRPATSSPAMGRSNGLLFGEILPEDSNTATAGYGIEGVRPRRTSESNLQSPTRHYFQRSASDANAEPASPTDWYRGTQSPGGSGDKGKASPRAPTNHNRAQSDLAGSKALPSLDTQRAVEQQQQQLQLQRQQQQQSQSKLQQLTSPTSRLPVSIKRLPSPSNTTSPVSTRSNSPAASKRLPISGNASSRQQQQQQGHLSASRAKTPTKPTNIPTTRSKTPTHATSSSSRKPRPTHIATPNNNRLNAYITAPPPKLSPPLRSSRPRQPVSAASTAASRMKAVDRGRSPHKTSSSRQGTRRDESGSQRRKIDVGPIDFAQRRETIRLAYSKSIRESEARLARQAAAEKRKKELEVAAKAKAQAEAIAVAQTKASKKQTAPAKSAETRPAADHALKISTTIPAKQPAPAPPPPLPDIQQQQQQQQPKSFDSPTLGIPGTFPAFGSPSLEQDETPQSAISATSAITEFDNEEQTEPPIVESLASPRADLGIQHHDEHPVLSHRRAEYRSPFELPVLEESGVSPHEDDQQRQELEETQTPAHEKAVYRYPFDDDEGMNDETVSIKISLDTSSPLRQSIPLMVDCGDVPVVPGSFRDDDEEQPFEFRDEPAPEGRQDAGVGHHVIEARSEPKYEPEPEPELELEPEPEPEPEPEHEHEPRFEPEPELQPQPQLRTEAAGRAEPEHEVEYQRFEEAHYEPELVGGHAQIEEAQYEPVADDADHGHTDDVQYDPEREVGYEPPQPYRTGSYQTTVTILSRDTDFTPPASFSRTGSVVRREPQMDSLEEFYVGGPSIRDSAAALRDSRCASDFSDEMRQNSAEIQRTPDTSNSLTVPPLLSPANRSSQQSGWTDFSIDSNDGNDYMAVKDPAVYSQESIAHARRSFAASVSRPESIAQGSTFEEDAYSPPVSPLDASRPQFPEYPTKHQLPELDTGDGFSVPYLAEGVAAPPRPPPPPPLPSSIPMLPDHEPPPVPSSESPSLHHHVTVHRSHSTSYFHQARPSNYSLASRDDVGSFTTITDDGRSPMLPRQSSDQVSLDIARQSMSGQTLVEPGRSTPENADGSRDSLSKEKPSKEQIRLTQRQMVIRELIDTESIFVRDMNIVEEIYKGTAEACPKLDAKTVKLIFRNTDEIILFHTSFLAQLKDAVSSVYSPKGRRSPQFKENREDPAASSDAVTTNSAMPGSQAAKANAVESEDGRDRLTSIGPVFSANIEKMQIVHEGFLRTSDHAAKRLIQIQEDPTVKVWLNECNEVAKDLTAAWNLDSLLIKPMQRITKYPNLISQLLQHTPSDHPDREALISARTDLENAILDINKTKKNFELVGQIVGRKRKESDVRAGFARAFGKRVDKLQASSNRPPEDAEYLKLNEKFGDDYLRLQVVLRDVEYYTRQVAAYVHEFLQYLSAMELVMRLQPSPYPELESKWARFNVSMRDMEKVALDQHLAQVRKHVIEPFELVIKCYGNPSLAMKKRAKRRLDYEKAMQLKKGGKKIDKQLSELVEQYEALNETLKKELPQLSAKTEQIGNICLGNFVNIQAKWFSIWKEKVKVVLEDQHVPEIAEIMHAFHREFKDMEEQISNVAILNPSLKSRTSQSTTDETMSRTRSRPSELSPRTRGGSVNSDIAPSLPTPDFAKRHSGQFAVAPGSAALPSPHQYYYRDYYGGLNLNGHARGGSGSPITPEASAGSRSMAGPGSGRPSTGRSIDSTNAPRPSIDSNAQAQASTHNRRDSVSTYNSNYPNQENRRFSGLFHSALPLPDDSEESRKSSRASSRERAPTGGYNVLWLAASLFEFNIETTKHEAGYPYLTYQAGEIFDVIAEKGELWLAKNQDDPNDLVGWIWSKHFAKLADS